MCILPGKAILEMIYTVSGGTLNPTHSLTQVIDGHCHQNFIVWLIVLLWCLAIHFDDIGNHSLPEHSVF